MALFGPKDKDVPLLTQVYQLDIPEPDPSPFKYLFYHTDLDKWIGQFSRDANGEPLEYWSDGFPQRSTLVDLLALRGPEGAEFDEEAYHKFEKNAEIGTRVHSLLPVIALAKRIMDSACDAGVLSEGDVLELYELSKFYRPKPLYEWQADDSGNIPLSRLRVTDFSPIAKGMEWKTIRALEAALIKAREEPGYFQRCQQCSSVFLLERKGTIYCSRRCNIRSQMQKLRDRKKSELLPRA